jgi:subtilase family serine protease
MTVRSQAYSVPSTQGRRRRCLAMAGACAAAALALAGCGNSAASQTASHALASGSGVVTVTAASNIKTLSDCAKLTPSPCYGVDHFLAAYGVEPLHSRGINGRGQSVVLLEFAPNQTSSATDSNLRHDFALFDGLFGLPAVRLQVITRFARMGDPYLAGGEEAMDAEMVHAVAPAATIRIVLIPPGTGDLQATGAGLINALRLAPSLGGTVAITAGISEGCVTHVGAANLNSALTTDENRHVTVIASAGDNGAAGGPCSGVVPASVRAVNLPASDPLVLAVGGTTLQASPTTGAYVDETAWNAPAPSLPAGAPKPPPSALAQLLATGSNGGFSSVFSRPAYQDGVPGIGHMRGVPDVSADADGHTGMAVAFSLTRGNVVTSADGTSASAPFWAGLVALADQDAGHALGFINPTIYRIGVSSSYHRAFHDITTGSNTITFPAGTVTGYQAGPGWDPVTGWGSPDAQILVPLLAAGGS